VAGRAPATGEPARSAVGSALRRLRELVVLGELKPGDQIRQDDMAAALGVSRVPLREALRVLASEGLLTHRLNQGYFVAELSVEEFRQIVALLEFLETELIRTARWPTPDEIAELRTLNAQLSTTATLSDPTSSNEANREFHFAVFRLSPLNVFATEAERYWALAEPFRLLHVATTDTSEIKAQHEQLIDALAAQDRALSIRVMNEHRRDTLAAALAALAGRDGLGRRRAVS
jgi:DNA-binding GntR family transcriptional regulator